MSKKNQQSKQNTPVEPAKGREGIGIHSDGGPTCVPTEAAEYLEESIERQKSLLETADQGGVESPQAPALENKAFTGYEVKSREVKLEFEGQGPAQYNSREITLQTGLDKS